MKQWQIIWKCSLLCQLLDRFSAFCGSQWEQSTIVTAFLSPPAWEQEVGKQSLLYKLWQAIRSLLTKLYQGLKLEKIFGGSLLIHPLLWTGLAVFSAPFVPTMVLLLVVMVAGATLLLDFLRKPEKTLVYAPMNRYIIFYGLLYLIMSLFSVTPKESLFVGLLSCAFILFGVILQNVVRDKRSFHLLLAAMVVAAGLVALYGMYQYIFRTGYQSEAWVDSDMFASISFRVPSTMDNPNMLGQYFILMIPFTGACLLSAKTWEGRIFWLVMAALQCVCMILTFSRGAWLGLLAAGVLFFLMLNPKLAYLIPVALVGVYFVLPDSVIDRFSSIGNMEDASTSYRVYIWMGTLKMLSHYWISGVGAGDVAFNLVYPAYSYAAIVAPHSHNLFLQILCDGGFFLLIIFCLMLIHYFRGLCASLRHSESFEGKLFRIAAFSSVAGFMVQAMTDYAFYNYRVMFLFWVVIGLGGLAMRYDRLEGEA